MNRKSGFVAIVGRANVGKSTLLNSLLKRKVSIVSEKAQTTRNKVLGIITQEEGQLILVDTPGMHKPKNYLDKYMVNIIKSSLYDVDAILFCIDVSEGVGPGDIFMANLLPKNKPLLLVLNKIDKASKEIIKESKKELMEIREFQEVFACCALEYKYVAGIKEILFDILPEGPQYYPKEQFSEMSDEMLISEIIREKALMYLDKEVPHGIAVVVDSIEDSGNDMYVEVSIIVERNSHKGIVIGKRGRKLKGIGKSARLELNKMFNENVHLSILVKVKKNWRKNSFYTHEYGYKYE